MRLFVSLPLDEAMRRHVRAIAGAIVIEDCNHDVRWVPPENLHVTLKFLGEVNDPEFPMIIEALRRVKWASVGITVGAPDSKRHAGRVHLITAPRCTCLLRRSRWPDEQTQKNPALSTFPLHPSETLPNMHLTVPGQRSDVTPAKPGAGLGLSGTGALACSSSRPPRANACTAGQARVTNYRALQIARTGRLTR